MSVLKKTNYFVKGLKEKPIYVYSKNELNQYELAIKNKIGNYNRVYHELYSPDIHLDVVVIPPTLEKNYYKLITKGMGAYKMSVPKELKYLKLDRAELVIYLPPDFNMDFTSKKYSWVIQQLKMIGRLPITTNSLIAPGNTFARDSEANVPMSDSVNYTAMLLVDSLDKYNRELCVNLDNGEKINFYQLIPIYKEEFKYQEQYGVEALFDLFEKNKLDVVVDLNRKNFCEDLELDKDNELDEIER